MSTNTTGDNRITPDDADDFGPDTIRLFVAYSATAQTTDDDTTSVPVYIEIPDTDWPVTDTRDEVADCLRLEGAIGVKFVEDDRTDERLFPRNESLEPMYAVTDPEYTGIGGPFVTTLERLQEMFCMTDFVSRPNAGPVVVDPERGPRFIGTLARIWRERRAGRTEEVPVVREGEIPPSDRTYIFVSFPDARYRNSPDLQPAVRRTERSSDVVPFAHGRALWSHIEIDWFCLLGEDRAIDAARQAVALVVGARSYNACLHYWEFVAGRHYDPRQGRSRARGDGSTAEDIEPVEHPAEDGEP